MDIVIKGILNYIQSLEGHKNSVLAGGAVRDQIYGLTPNDYDIFIPSERPRDIEHLVQSVGQEFSIDGAVSKTHEYPQFQPFADRKSRDQGQRITSVWGFEFEGKKIDLIGQKDPDDEDFPFEVIRGFDYGVNMVYDNGSYVDREDQNFQYDFNNHCMSLINLQSIEGLPKAVKRYETFSERYRQSSGITLQFRTPCLKFTDKKPMSDSYTIFQDDHYRSSVGVTRNDFFGDRSLNEVTPMPVQETLNRPTSTRPVAMRTTDVGNGLSAFRETNQPEITQEGQWVGEAINQELTFQAPRTTMSLEELQRIFNR